LRAVELEENTERLDLAEIRQAEADLKREAEEVFGRTPSETSSTTRQRNQRLAEIRQEEADAKKGKTLSGPDRVLRGETPGGPPRVSRGARGPSKTPAGRRFPATCRKPRRVAIELRPASGRKSDAKGPGGAGSQPPLFAVLVLIAAGPMTERERELPERDRQFMEGQRGRER
jgi:hypothetical protein